MLLSPQFSRRTTPAVAVPSREGSRFYQRGLPPDCPLCPSACVDCVLVALAGGRAGGPLPSRGVRRRRRPCSSETLSPPGSRVGPRALVPVAPAGPQHAPGLVPVCRAHTRFLRMEGVNLMMTFPAPMPRRPALGMPMPGRGPDLRSAPCSPGEAAPGVMGCDGAAPASDFSVCPPSPGTLPRVLWLGPAFH